MSFVAPKVWPEGWVPGDPCQECNSTGLLHHTVTEYEGDTWDEPQPIQVQTVSYCACPYGTELADMDMDRSF